MRHYRSLLRRCSFFSPPPLLPFSLKPASNGLLFPPLDWNCSYQSLSNGQILWTFLHSLFEIRLCPVPWHSPFLYTEALCYDFHDTLSEKQAWPTRGRLAVLGCQCLWYNDWKMGACVQMPQLPPCLMRWLWQILSRFPDTSSGTELVSHSENPFVNKSCISSPPFSLSHPYFFTGAPGSGLILWLFYPLECNGSIYVPILSLGLHTLACSLGILPLLRQRAQTSLQNEITHVQRKSLQLQWESSAKSKANLQLTHCWP